MKRSYDNRSIVAGAAAARSESQEMSPAYLKLIADCWEHIFDYLSFRDILQMGQTCKRMNQMAGYYIREYYPQLEFQLQEGKVYSQGVCLQTDFYPFIGRLVLKRDNNALKLLSNANKFDALKTIEISNKAFFEIQIEYMSDTLKNVENMKIEVCACLVNFFEQFANCCPKLKQMQVVYNMPFDAELFSQYYPNLECLKYFAWKYSRIDELKTFFVKHSKLKELHIQFEFLWANQDVLFQTHIQLDFLNVSFSVLNQSTTFDESIEFLKTLYDRKFYKTVQLSLNDYHIDRELMSHAISSLPQFEKLYISNDSNLDLGRFTNLKELQIIQFDRTTNIETLAKSWPNLEQFVIYNADIESILPFIRHTKNLKTIKIKYLSWSGLDLFVLNKERKKLENACQVSIYADDDIYLYPKWKSHISKLELDFVKIIRLDSFELSRLGLGY